MNTLAASACIALTSLGIAAPAAIAQPAPAQENVVVAHFDDGDSHGHSGSEPENDDPVTDSGPNKVTDTLKGTLETSDSDE